MSTTDERAHLDRCRALMLNFIMDPPLRLACVAGLIEFMPVDCTFTEADKLMETILHGYPVPFDDKQVARWYPHIVMWQEIAKTFGIIPGDMMPTDEDIEKLRVEWLKSKL